jgi:hypothetical protein
MGSATTRGTTPRLLMTALIALFAAGCAEMYGGVTTDLADLGGHPADSDYAAVVGGTFGCLSPEPTLDFVVQARRGSHVIDFGLGTQLPLMLPIGDSDVSLLVNSNMLLGGGLYKYMYGGDVVLFPPVTATLGLGLGAGVASGEGRERKFYFMRADVSGTIGLGVGLPAQLAVHVGARGLRSSP